MIEQGNISSQIALKKQMAYDKKSLEAIQKTLQFCGLKLESEIDFRAIKIYQIDHLHQIYTKNEQAALPNIVLLHGFGGTSMTFVRFFKNLKSHYRVHAIDALGVGHSSKGVFKNNFTYEEARNYFIDAIEQWRKRLGLESFVLAGHSFGGYLAACYTQSYPDRVSRLILLSPAGTTEKTPQQIQQELSNRYKNDGLRGKFFNLFAERVYNLKIRPSKAMGAFILGERLIDRIIDVRLKLKHQQGEAWKAYFKELTKRESVSEVGFYIIFQWPLKTKHTIESMIEMMNFNKPIEFYYGQEDWMDSCGAERLASKHKNIKFNKITEAGHQLIFDNPDEICYYILLRRTTEQLSMQSKYESSLKSVKKEEKEEEKEETIASVVLL